MRLALCVTALCAPALGASASPPGSPWREAPAYVALFAPPLHREAYRAFVSPEPLDAALRTVIGDPDALQGPGSWRPRPLLPEDAFGEGGPYDRRAIARLYGSRRASVARGPYTSDGSAEMWTLVSPYPSPSLDHLEAGTLLIILRVP